MFISFIVTEIFLTVAIWETIAYKANLIIVKYLYLGQIIYSKLNMANNDNKILFIVFLCILHVSLYSPASSFISVRNVGGFNSVTVLVSNVVYFLYEFNNTSLFSLKY